jgi:DNA polymerase-3 subunit delta'
MADYASAIAERAGDGGLYHAASGSDAIFVATTRALLRIAAMSPAVATRKVFVIGDADRMVPQEGAEAAANAFLKLLEEPPADTTIILTSSVPGILLPTIRSRVVAVRVPYLPDNAVRGFLSDPLAHAALSANGWSRDTEDAVSLAGGAPGVLLGTADASGSAERAQRILAAAMATDRRAERFALAVSAGAAKARSGFTETLDALVAALHREARKSVEAEVPQRALAASLAIDAVDRARTRAWANVNPQLITASLFDDLSRIFHG